MRLFGVGRPTRSAGRLVWVDLTNRACLLFYYDRRVCIELAINVLLPFSGKIPYCIAQKWLAETRVGGSDWQAMRKESSPPGLPQRSHAFCAVMGTGYRYLYHTAGMNS